MPLLFFSQQSTIYVLGAKPPIYYIPNPKIPQGTLNIEFNFAIMTEKLNRNKEINLGFTQQY